MLLPYYLTLCVLSRFIGFFCGSCIHSLHFYLIVYHLYLLFTMLCRMWSCVFAWRGVWECKLDNLCILWHIWACNLRNKSIFLLQTTKVWLFIVSWENYKVKIITQHHYHARTQHALILIQKSMFTNNNTLTVHNCSVYNAFCKFPIY